MKSVGIIAEYNPFHNGHLYQLERVRKRTNTDAIIVLMSGNVVQRGEYSILDKWQRAHLALEYGADLVIELPILVSLQAADFFASRSVALLEKIGCNQIAFGTETATEVELNSFLNWQLAAQDKIDQEIQSYLTQGYSYASAYQQALESIEGYDDFAKFNPTSPNHILGLQYLKQNKKLTHPLEIIAIPRAKSHNATEIMSGSQIREIIQNGQQINNVVPTLTQEYIEKSSLTMMEDYWPYLRYQILSQGVIGLSRIMGYKEGIENRVYKLSQENQNLECLSRNLTSKRWTRSSINRLLMMTLLNITEQEWNQQLSLFEKSPILRVLGYTKVGRQYLREMSKNKSVTLFSNYKRSYQDRYGLNIKADQIMVLANEKEKRDQIFQRYPIYVKNREK